MKNIQEAYIVAATRTPVAKAPRGAFKNVHPADMLAHCLRQVVARLRASIPSVSTMSSSVVPCPRASKA